MGNEVGKVKLGDNHELPLLGWAPGKDVDKSMEAALKAGYRHISTDYNNHDEADVGRVLGKWLYDHHLKRKDVFVSARLPFIGNHTTRVESFIRKSLHNLRLHYVDLYLISSPVGFTYNGDDALLFPMTDNGMSGKEIDLDRHTDIVAIWKAMESLVDKKLAKSIGVCHFNLRQLRMVIRNARITPAVLMVECHAYFQQRELREFCAKHEITVVSTFPCGVNTELFPRTLNYTDCTKYPSPCQDSVVGEIAMQYEITPHQILVAFLLKNNIGVILTGAELKEMAQDCTKVLHFQLTKDELEAISNLDRGTSGRALDFRSVFPGFDTHPQNPFEDTFLLSSSSASGIESELALMNLPRNWN